MEEKITGILVDTITNRITVETIDNQYERYLHILRCTDIDIADFWLDGIDFAAIYGKEEMSRTEHGPTVIDCNNHGVIFGSIFICRHKLDGALVSIDKDDCECIYKNAGQSINDNEHQPIIKNVVMDSEI